MSCTPGLADQLARVLAETGPLAGHRLARIVRRRNETVYAVLYQDARFVRIGGPRRSARWTVTAPSTFKTKRPQAEPGGQPASALLHRGEAIRKLIATGQVHPLDGLVLVVWPSRTLLELEAAA